MKKIAIVTVNFNSENETLNCLESLYKLDTKNILLEIIVVDNGSKIPLSPKEYNKKNNIHLIQIKVNEGFTGGYNKGIRYALKLGVDYILLLNNDTVADKKILQELLSSVEMDGNIGLVASKIYFAKGHEFHKDRYKAEELGKVFWYAGGGIDWENVFSFHRGVDEVDKGQYEKLEQTEFVTGCCMFIRKEVIEKVGMLDEKYFLYFEDADLSVRVKKAGYKIIYNPKSIIWHVNAASGGGSGSVLQDYYITRNRMLFGFKYAPLRSKFALVRESVKLMFRGRIWQKKGIRDFYLNKFGRGSFKI